MFLVLSFNSAFATVFFIDTNNNDLEIEAAREQAEAKGEKFYYYPEKDMQLDHEVLTELLTKHTPETLFISGHDGGGSISGGQGGLDREFFESLRESHPEVTDNIRVLGLMGCNTANHAEVLDWKNVMPNLSFIAGYDGSAPSQKWLQGRQYIQEIIEKKDKILSMEDEALIKEAFEGFSNFDVLQATLYFDSPKCNNPAFYEDQYIYRPLNPDGEFSIFLDNNCGEKISYFETQMSELYQQYKDGEVAMPEDTSQGPMRDMYTYIRQNEHCLRAMDEFPSGNNALFLLFSKAVQENFSHYYAEVLEKYFKELEVFKNAESLDALRSEIIAKLNKRKEMLLKIKDNPSLLKDFVLKEEKNLVSQLKKYPASYSAIAEELIARANAGESTESVLAGQPEDMLDFVKLFFQHKYFKEYVVNNISETITNIGDEIEYYLEDIDNEITSYNNENWDTTKQSLIDNYNSLGAYSSEELAKLSRADVVNFIHKAESLEMSFTQRPEFVEDTQEAFDSILYELDGESIHFNWHDSNMGDPMDPEYGYLHRDQIMKAYSLDRASSMSDSQLESEIIQELTGFVID